MRMQKSRAKRAFVLRNGCIDCGIARSSIPLDQEAIIEAVSWRNTDEAAPLVWKAPSRNSRLGASASATARVGGEKQGLAAGRGCGML